MLDITEQVARLLSDGYVPRGWRPCWAGLIYQCKQRIADSGGLESALGTVSVERLHDTFCLEGNFFLYTPTLVFLPVTHFPLVSDQMLPDRSIWSAPRNPSAKFHESKVATK